LPGEKVEVGLIHNGKRNFYSSNEGSSSGGGHSEIKHPRPPGWEFLQ